MPLSYPLFLVFFITILTWESLACSSEGKLCGNVNHPLQSCSDKDTFLPSRWRKSEAKPNQSKLTSTHYCDVHSTAQLPAKISPVDNSSNMTICVQG